MGVVRGKSRVVGDEYSVYELGMNEETIGIPFGCCDWNSESDSNI